MRTIRDCAVAVVGGCGFLGSHLVEHLVGDRGCKVLAIDNLCVGRLDFLHRDAEFHHHDITTSEDHLRNVLRAFGVRHVFNYAAWPYIPDSFVRPLHVADVNFTGALKVINAAQEAGCESILQVSSAEIYGEGTQTGPTEKINEDDPVNPHSTYGAAKAAVDSYCRVAWKERKTPVVALRQFNCVGERETHPYVVPEIISQLAGQQVPDLAGEATRRMRGPIGNPGIVKLGNNSFRDFLYAGDQARIAVELLERGQFGEVYNLGSETGVEVYALAEMIGGLMGFAYTAILPDESRRRPWEIWHLQSDNMKLWTALLERGTPRDRQLVPLDEALRRTIKWFEENGRMWPWEKR